MEIEKEELKKLLVEALMESEVLTTVVEHTIKETLTTMGMDAQHPLEMQRDFQTLREWRELTLQLRRKGYLVFVGFLVTIFLAAAWAGFKSATFKIF